MKEGRKKENEKEGDVLQKEMVEKVQREHRKHVYDVEERG